MNEFLQASRPILFESSLGDHSSETVYWGKGTSFLASYNGQYYLITANHVMKNQSATHDLLRIFPTDTSNYTIPFNAQYELKPLNQNEQEEYHDIYLMRIDIPMQIRNSDSPLFAIDLNKSIMSPESLSIDTKLGIIGFPADNREVDYEFLKIKYKRSVMSAKYKGRSSFDHCYSLCITDSLGHESIDGMSGSPVFYFQNIKEIAIPRLVGMMIRGSVESGNGHFVSVLALKKALDEIIAQEA